MTSAELGMFMFLGVVLVLLVVNAVLNRKLTEARRQLDQMSRFRTGDGFRKRALYTDYDQEEKQLRSPRGDSNTAGRAGR